VGRRRRHRQPTQKERLPFVGTQARDRAQCSKTVAQKKKEKKKKRKIIDLKINIWRGTLARTRQARFK
jgi:hypothetical protein